MKRTVMAALVSSALASPLVMAQNTAQPASQGQQGQQNAPANQAPATQNISAANFVAQAASSNMLEIESSQLALDRSKHNQVRDFAEKMVKDHSAAAERMKSAAAGQQIPANMSKAHSQMLDQLRSVKADQFDARYLQLQLQAHQQAVALHEQFAQSGESGPLQQYAQQTLPTLREHLQSVQQIGNNVAPDQMASTLQGTQQETSKIVVERDAPRVHVEQASPRITVRQAQPEVSVQQAQPELIVHQPAPTITVDIPQPQITVRMPQPDVQVSLQKPEVQVEQPQPEVQVQEAQQPQVQIQGAQPIASVEGAQSPEPKINYQQSEGQPTIRYERAEPKIVVNKAEGQPEVRVERVPAGQQTQGQQNQTQPATQRLVPPGQTATQEGAGQGQQATQQVVPPGQTNADQAQRGNDQAAVEERQKRIRDRFGLDDPNRKDGPDRSAAQMRELTVSDIEGMDVHNANGEKIGDVGNVVQDANGRQFVVITEGGFFGIGEDQAALPLERFWVQEDRLVAHGITEDDIKALGNYREQADQYQDVDDNTKASVGVWQ